MEALGQVKGACRLGWRAFEIRGMALSIFERVLSITNNFLLKAVI